MPLDDTRAAALVDLGRARPQLLDERAHAARGSPETRASSRTDCVKHVHGSHRSVAVAGGHATRHACGRLYERSAAIAAVARPPSGRWLLRAVIWRRVDGARSKCVRRGAGYVVTDSPPPHLAILPLADAGTRAIWPAGRRPGRRGVLQQQQPHVRLLDRVLHAALVVSLSSAAALILSRWRSAATGRATGPAACHRARAAEPLRFRHHPVQELAKRAAEPQRRRHVVTLWASMGVFGAITSAVNHAWGVETAVRLLQAQAHRVPHAGRRRAAADRRRWSSIGTVQVVEAHWFPACVARYFRSCIT